MAAGRAAADVVAVEAVDAPTTYTYRQLDEAACRIAHWALAQGLQQRDVVRAPRPQPRSHPRLQAPVAP